MIVRKLIMIMTRSLVWIWNPFPKKLKIKDVKGRYILDTCGRRKDKLFTKRVLDQRKARGEEVTKCYKIGLKSSVGFTGSTK